MYNLTEWSETLDLSDFYARAKQKGFENNSSQKILVDCFAAEREKQVWILYHNDIAIGSVAAHSLDIMGRNSYRICARTCILTEHTDIFHLRTVKKTIQEHQNITAQYFIPKCIEWAGLDKDLYITSNESKSGSQRLVHSIYCPALERTGALTNVTSLHYRGLKQTFWKLNINTFLEQLEKFGKWQ